MKETDADFTLATESRSYTRGETSHLWRTRAELLLIGMTFIKLIFIATTKISNCEAYYYIWSRFLDWSYYDHPPMVAWMTWLTTQLGHSDFAIRLGSVICSSLLGWWSFCLGSRLFSQRAGFFSLAIVSILPAFLFVGFVLCPEAPMSALWVLDLILIERMRDHDQFWRPLVVGLTLGLTFLAKYTAIILVLVILLYALVSPLFRRWLKRPSFYAGGLVSLMVALPVIYWNSLRGWPSLKLHFIERAATFNLSNFLQNALHISYVQWGGFHPFLFPALIAALIYSIFRALRDDRFRFLATASLPVLLFLIITMLSVKDPEGHWTLVGYIPLCIASGAWLDDRMKRPLSLLLKRYIYACIGFTSAAALFIYAYTLSPTLLDYLPRQAYDADTNFISELWGWDQVETAVRDEVSSLGKNTVLASTHFTLCAHLMAQVGDQPPVYCPSPRQSEFDFLNRRYPPHEAPILFINSDRYSETPSQLLPERDCQFLKILTIQRTRVLQHYRIYTCKPLTTR